MIHSTFNVASSLSLMLCCVIAAAWAWGRSTPRAFEFGYQGQVWQVVTDAGRLRIDNEPQRSLEVKPARCLNALRAELLTKHEMLSEVTWRNRRDPDESTRRAWQELAVIEPTLKRLMRRPVVPVAPVTPAGEFSFHTGTLLVVTGILPVVRLTGWSLAIARRRSRCKAGCCEVCGYGLRAAPGRCPECGAATRHG